MADALLSDAEYERLRRAAATHREDLVVRLAGEVGLRPDEMTRLRPDDVVDYGDQFLLTVRENDGDREAYLPADVEHDLRKYGGDAGPEERFFDVTARRLQMLVREVADRAAADEVDPLASVSSRDLRRHFARSRLADGVPAQVVQAVGGWDRLESLDPLLDEPDRQTVTAAFDGGRTERRAMNVIAASAAATTAIATADDRESVAAAVCEHLADAAGYRFAVVAGFEGVFVTRAAAGVPADRADDLLDEWAREAVEQREIRVRPPGPADDGAVFVPLVEDGSSRGVLAVGVDDSPSDAERDALSVVGSLIGHALAAVSHRRLLDADVVTRLEFRIRDRDDVFAALTGTVDCEISSSGFAPADDGLVCFVVVEGADAAATLSAAADHPAVADCRLVEDYGDGAFVELVVETGPAVVLHDRGARIRDVTADDGVAKLIVEVPTDADLRPLVDAATDASPSTRLAAKRQTERTFETAPGFRERLDENLTERQETALRTAFYGGYFEWPRGSTAEELADAIGVSSPTLHNHLRRAERKLLAAFYDEQTDS